mmetsp:Transcript_17858/g.15764  ORF Transcript_17858/g.15764 Transcript_17858/m.15764 type:complete len:124 (-) Transcript_17858:249-620(-)
MEVDSRLSIPLKKKLVKALLLPLAIKKIGINSETFHWNIIIPPDYPFKPPQVYNLNGINHSDIDPHTGMLSISCLIDQWSPVLTLKTIVLVLQLFINGTLQDFEPQEMLHKDRTYPNKARETG